MSVFFNMPPKRQHKGSGSEIDPSSGCRATLESLFITSPDIKGPSTGQLNFHHSLFLAEGLGQVRAVQEGAYVTVSTPDEDARVSHLGEAPSSIAVFYRLISQEPLPGRPRASRPF